jgi:hypothetical protein
VPIRAGAVPETIPDPQKQPGKRRQNDQDQVGQSRFFPKPTKNNKQDDTGVKHKKENIQEGIHVLFLYQYFTEMCNRKTKRDESFFEQSTYIQVGMGKEDAR